MNKMQGLAKTLITIFGIYWLIRMGLIAARTILIIITCAAVTKDKNTNTLSMYLEISLIIVAMLIILKILFKRDKIAEKIAGGEEKPMYITQTDLAPFVFRLTCVIAGMYCFYRATSSISSIAYHPLYMGIFEKMKLDFLCISQFIGYIEVVILLAGGFYLVSGAPHFVRWQVKKTIEMCGKM